MPVTSTEYNGVTYKVGDSVRIRYWNDVLDDSEDYYVDGDGDISLSGDYDFGYYFHSLRDNHEGDIGEIIKMTTPIDDVADLVIMFEGDPNEYYIPLPVVELEERAKAMKEAPHFDSWFLILNPS